MRNLFRSLIPMLLLVTGTALADPTPQQLLEAADAMRNPAGDFSINIDLTEYRAGKLVGNSSLTVYSKPAQDSGQFNSLVRFERPMRDAGKLLLRNGRDLWFYDPSSSSSIRISPQARLLGQASNGDVTSSNLAADYRAEWIATETIEDASRTPRECARLQLTAVRDTVAYPTVDYWIDVVTHQPVKAEFHTAEGRLLKTAYFRRFEQHLGSERPTETVIIDALDPTWITVMRASDYQQQNIPHSWFQRGYLARFGTDGS